MQNYANAHALQGANIVTAEAAIEVIRAGLGSACRVVMVVSGVVDGEVSGVVMGDTPDDDYISSQELAAGVVYLIVGVGKVPTVQPSGVVVLAATPAPQEEPTP
jgi:hypothetical protein